MNVHHVGPTRRGYAFTNWKMHVLCHRLALFPVKRHRQPPNIPRINRVTSNQMFGQRESSAVMNRIYLVCHHTFKSRHTHLVVMDQLNVAGISFIIWGSDCYLSLARPSTLSGLSLDMSSYYSKKLCTTTIKWKRRLKKLWYIPKWLIWRTSLNSTWGALGDIWVCSPVRKQRCFGVKYFGCKCLHCIFQLTVQWKLMMVVWHRWAPRKWCLSWTKVNMSWAEHHWAGTLKRH